MAKINYQKGDKIGSLIFLNREPYRKDPDSPMANFLCQCGKEFVTRIQNVKSGRTKSCGCLTKKFIGEASKKYDLPEKVIEEGVLKYKPIPKLPFEEEMRFWSKVELRASPFVCWNWTGIGKRYGEFTIGRYHFKSNRVAYFLTHKQDPKEKSVLHKCDNPKCCNPNHLSLGTHFENMQDMSLKGRASRGIEKNTCKLSENQVRLIRSEFENGISASILATKNGVSVTNVRAIVNKSTWKHIV